MTLDDDSPTPESPQRGTSLLCGPHTIEVDFETPGAMAEFLEALAFILRSKRRVTITIE